MPRTYVIIPTYNEAENIEGLLKAILNLKIEGLVPVVVDDNSPDGTGQIAQKIPGVKTIIRTKDRGRGRAGIEAFKFALKEGADYIIEMDADFSHHPKYIPDLLKHIQNHDVVLGSRFVPGGKDINRSFIRQIVTKFAQTYIKLVLGLKVKDPTSGYRCFRRKVLAALPLEQMISVGPPIVSEILYNVKLNGFSIYETPIVFEDRTRGETKLNLAVLLKTLWLVLKFRLIYK